MIYIETINKKGDSRQNLLAFFEIIKLKKAPMKFIGAAHEAVANMGMISK